MVIETKGRPPAALFTECMIAMVTFDREKPSQDDFAWSESGNILQFLWAASKDFLQPAVFEITNDEKADGW